MTSDRFLLFFKSRSYRLLIVVPRVKPGLRDTSRSPETVSTTHYNAYNAFNLPRHIRRLKADSVLN